MARKATLAAGVLSLILVGTWGKALAGTQTVGSIDSNPGYVTLFGKTFCFAHAPSVVNCDWRMPEAKAQPAPTAKTSAFTVFGKRYCLGSATEGPCDYRFPPTEKADPESKVFSVLGLNFCFGNVPSDTRCAVKLPADQQNSGQLRASL